VRTTTVNVYVSVNTCIAVVPHILVCVHWIVSRVLCFGISSRHYCNCIYLSPVVYCVYSRFVVRRETAPLHGIPFATLISPAVNWSTCMFAFDLLF
jgi:hypothetical protein